MDPVPAVSVQHAPGCALHITRLPDLLPVRWTAILRSSLAEQLRMRSRKKVQKDLVEAEATLERFTW